MKVEIVPIGFQQDYRMDIFHTWKLFYEEVEIVYPGEQTGEAAWRMTIELTDLGGQAAREVHATVKLEAADQHQAEANALAAWTSTETHRLRSTTPDNQKRETKRVICKAMLHALEHATGLEMPWGILTGVRPTKLIHNLLAKHGRGASIKLLQEEYLLTDEKALLLADIAERQLKVIPDLFDLDHEVSVYIGIPFCPTKCAYCTFPAYDIRGNNGSVNAFLDGLHHELRETGRWLKQAGLGITTIYWGGGTPTSITAEEMDALFVTLHESFPAMDRVRELTVEAGRPDTITPDKLRVMRKWNVDRISINPQSFTQLTLDKIGRHHTVDETIEKFILSREMGMDNINMDLIIGLPNEGIDEFQHTLDETAKLLPESLTVHTLSFKRASKMTKNRDQYEVAERDEIGDMMKMATHFMDENKYVPYYLYRQKNMLGNLENVGYSLEGRESLYNIVMMEERQTIIGVGCGAVSKVLYPKQLDAEGNEVRKIERFPNPKEPSVYNQAYREYLDKKLKLMDEAYDRQPVSGV
ncbi:coproporphyrinogen III oxidase [Paenibacillus koleovorans]|uniref:coproporphyrinogen III oxidase n=1 Tax=Paenibacillus koleovorans TaxID=121608 RepID=UPI000FDAC70E|nr:coproporphyrinogen III oxidase [Paenibacillus koleovorans]